MTSSWHVATRATSNDSILAERTRRGEIAEIGRGMGRNVEQIIATHPEIIMQGLQESDAKDEDIRASGIEIVFLQQLEGARASSGVPSG